MNDLIVTLYAGSGSPAKLADIADLYFNQEEPAKVIGMRVEVTISRTRWELLPKGRLKEILTNEGYPTAFNVQPAIEGWMEVLGRAYTSVLALLA